MFTVFFTRFETLKKYTQLESGCDDIFLSHLLPYYNTKFERLVANNYHYISLFYHLICLHISKFEMIYATRRRALKCFQDLKDDMIP
jgi:hypothetical protein